MKLLDTNIIVYAAGRPDPNRDACRSLLVDVDRNPDRYAIDVELLQELLDVYTRRGQRAFAAQIVRQTLSSFEDPFPVTRREIEEAADLVKGYRRVTPRDAIHAAVVVTYDLEGIVSADRSFDQISEVARFDPRSLATEL